MKQQPMTPFELWAQRRNRARNWVRDGRIIKGYPTSDNGPMVPPDEHDVSPSMETLAGIINESDTRSRVPETVSMFDDGGGS